MEVAYPQLFLFFSFFILPWLSNWPTITATVTTSKPKRWTMKMIHYHSIYSPNYNPKSSVEDRGKHALESSNVRYAYLQARTKISFSKLHYHRARLLPQSDGNLFLVNLSIGEPPIPQLVTMDTASSLFWIQCRCGEKCSHRPSTPIYEPSNSSTYTNVSCASPYCYSFVSECHEGLCRFGLGYVDGDRAFGILAFEKITLENGTTLPHVLFGCATSTKMLPGQWNGILGLGPEQESIVSQVGGSKFSYCIGNIEDPTYKYNHLVVGYVAKSVGEGDTTPLETHEHYYYLLLESIIVGEEPLNIDPKIFQRDPLGHGGVIFDTGSPLTFLHTDAFNALTRKVRDHMYDRLWEVVVPAQPDMLCYEGNMTSDLEGFPMVTFKFNGGAEINLDTESMFLTLRRGIFCMAMKPARDGKSMIGVFAQQHYNVGYDLKTKAISFQRVDCEFLSQNQLTM